MSGINPQAWFADTLARLAAGHSATALDQLMPWNYATAVA
ncbi:transposase domain-containing protein [Sphingomonas sp.]